MPEKDKKTKKSAKEEGNENKVSKKTDPKINEKTDPKMVPEINIGIVGHVDHGKTTLTSVLTGKWTDTHSEEIKRGITIRLGYADATIYKCKKCEGPACYGTTKKCINCFGDCTPQRTVSIVDAPGHEMLMTTVLSGTALMDGAILIISANEECPQPQTQEHLSALNIVGIKNIIIVQNKIDVVTPEQVKKNYSQIQKFIKGTIAENAPIIPISAQQRINIDALVETIETTIPTQKKERSGDPLLLIARSFDVNKPGTKIKSLKGSVLGGSLVHGTLKVGDEIEIGPGIKKDGQNDYETLKTTITGLQKSLKDMDEVGPGGLLGVSTSLDPSLGKSDSLSGSVAGIPGKIPPTITNLKLEVHLLKRIVGQKDSDNVESIKTGEPLMITVGISRTVGTVTNASSKDVTVKLKLPICARVGDRAAVSRQISGRWRLIGLGTVNK